MHHPITNLVLVLTLLIVAIAVIARSLATDSTGLHHGLEADAQLSARLPEVFTRRLDLVHELFTCDLLLQRAKSTCVFDVTIHALEGPEDRPGVASFLYSVCINGCIGPEGQRDIPGISLHSPCR